MNTATWAVQSNKLKTSQTLQLINALRRLDEPFVDVAIDAEHGLLAPIDIAIAIADTKNRVNLPGKFNHDQSR